MSMMIEKAKSFAKQKHDEAGQVDYFERHIMRVFDLAVDYLLENMVAYGDMAESDYRKNTVVDNINAVHLKYKEFLSAIILHDTIEDTTTTFNEIVDNFGETVANLVFAVTDEDGKNRKEKKMKTYGKIRKYRNAVRIKLLDRIANVEQSTYGTEKDRAYLNMYMKEYYTFKCALWNGDNDEDQKLWNILDKLHGFRL